MGATEAFTSAQQTTATFRKELINTIAVCVVVSLLVILIVQVFTKYIVMIIVLGFFFTSLGAIYFVWASFLSAFEPESYASMCQLGSIEICEVLTGNQTASAADIQSKQRIAYGVSFVCGLVVLTICCCWNNIRLAVQLFDEAGRCVFSMPFLLLQPIYTFLVSVICVWIFKAQLYYTTSVNVAVIDVDGIDAGTREIGKIPKQWF